MRRRKAARPANPKVRKPRRADRCGGQIGTDAIPDIMVMQAVYGGEPFRCIGFVYSRGRDGYEGFDRETRSLGLFTTTRTAADAVTRAAGDGS